MSAVSCTSDETGPNVSGVDGTGIVEVRIQPAVDTMLIPDTVRTSDRLTLKAIAIGRTGTDISVTKFVWRSSDPTVARVDTTGIVTPVKTGTVEITASAYRVGTAKIVILPAANRILVTPRVDTIFNDEPASATSDSSRLVAQAYDAANQALSGVRYIWQSSSASVASIDPTGLASALAFGTTTLTVSGNGMQTTASVHVRPRTERIEISPLVDSIFVDDPVVSVSDTARPVAKAFDLAGVQLASGVRYTWQSSAPNVATVDANGIVRALTLGTMTVTLRAAISQATATVTVLPIVKNVSVSSPLLQVLAGDTVRLTAKAFDYKDQAIARRFAWTSSDVAVATIDTTGQVIFVAPGTATFTVGSDYRTATVSVTALPRQLLSVDVGGDVSCGITPLGRGYCWGRGDVGQLASSADSTCFDDGSPGLRTACTLEPKRFSKELPFTMVASGDLASCGISSQLLYCWGSDQFGQIGNGGKGSGATPNLATVGSERFVFVTSGSFHNCALNTSGAAYCWGRDDDGQLGDHRRVNSTTPIPVVGPSGFPADAPRFMKISAGGSHTCGLTPNGSIYCWGEGTLGALGTGSIASSDTPAPIVAPEPFTDVSAGFNHSCAVGVSGKAYCWGADSSGQLGFASLLPVLAPTAVGVGVYTAVSAGTDFTCGLTTGRTINCWGRNSHGQLGRGEPSPGGSFATPASVVSPVNFVSVSAGRRHACALATDGETYCWGSNMLGSLGNRLQAAVRSLPQKVAPPR
ncbi:MAG: Ig-like domain-containing protein [Gemmatimonadaceae bacterium]